MPELCKHETGVLIDGQIVGCTYCNGKETAMPDQQDERPVNWWFEPKAPVDPDIRLAAGIAAGEICGRCLTQVAPIGCDCSRKRHHRYSIGDMAEWLHQQVDDCTLGGKEAAGIALSAAKRSQRRAGLVHEPVDPDNPAGITVAAEEHLGLMAEFDVTPTWRAPRVNEPTHLPV